MAQKTYQHYYTSNDVNVYLESTINTSKVVHLDQLVSIAYTHNVSTVPLYGLGKLEPIFFSRGNSLIQGQLDIAFTNTSYIKTGLDYIGVTLEEVEKYLSGSTSSTSSSTSTATNTLVYSSSAATDTSVTVEGNEKVTLADGTTKSINDLSNEEFKKLSENSATTGTGTVTTKSIIDIVSPFNIRIDYNNTNSSTDGVSSNITIVGAKFNAESVAISAHDDTALVVRLLFMAKNVK